jgi:hypothetical protein
LVTVDEHTLILRSSAASEAGVVPTVKVSATFYNVRNRKESCERWTAVPRRGKRWITTGVNDVAVQIGDGSERWQKKELAVMYSVAARDRKGSAGFYT